MTLGIAQCLPQNSYFGVAVAVLLSNSLICFFVSYVVYAFWSGKEQYKEQSVPIFMTILLCCMGFIIKLTTEHVHSGYPLAPDCRIGYVLSIGPTFPSLHVAVVVMLTILFSKPFYERISAQASPNEPDPGMTQNEAWIRLIVVIIYAISVCYARFYLTLNGIWDVLLGTVLGIMFAFLERYIRPKLHEKFHTH